LRVQPTWPDRTPDKITDVTGGGFVDGNGVPHHMPVQMQGLNVSVERDEKGFWHWVGRPDL